jgi:hypothetical protein
MVDRLIAGLDHRGHEIVEKNNPAKGQAWCLPIPVASQRRIQSRLAEHYELERKWRRRGAAAESGLCFGNGPTHPASSRTTCEFPN